MNSFCTKHKRDTLTILPNCSGRHTSGAWKLICLPWVTENKLQFKGKLGYEGPILRDTPQMWRGWCRISFYAEVLARAMVLIPLHLDNMDRSSI